MTLSTRPCWNTLCGGPSWCSGGVLTFAVPQLATQRNGGAFRARPAGFRTREGYGFRSSIYVGSDGGDRAADYRPPDVPPAVPAGGPGDAPLPQGRDPPGHAPP